jgi:hypothetical protein
MLVPFVALLSTTNTVWTSFSKSPGRWLICALNMSAAAAAQQELLHRGLGLVVHDPKLSAGRGAASAGACSVRRDRASAAAAAADADTSIHAARRHCMSCALLIA